MTDNVKNIKELFDNSIIPENLHTAFFDGTFSLHYWKENEFHYIPIDNVFSIHNHEKRLVSENDFKKMSGEEFIGYIYKK